MRLVEPSRLVERVETCRASWTALAPLVWRLRRPAVSSIVQRSTSSTGGATRSTGGAHRSPSGASFALAVVLALVGIACAGAAKPAPEPEAAPEAANGSVVTLQFANGSSKASVSVDLSTTDVQLDMRTKARKDSAPAPAAPSPTADAPRPASLPGTAATPAPATAATDSVTRLVVAGIRRGQDLFLKGDLVRAQSEIDATLALRPTAEARALAGSIAWVRGDKALARGHWQTALALDPSQPGVADMLARTEPGAAPEAGKALPR